MTRHLIRALLACSILVPMLAHAVCYYGGYPYPTGTKIEGKICQADGTWR